MVCPDGTTHLLSVGLALDYFLLGKYSNGFLILILIFPFASCVALGKLTSLSTGTHVCKIMRAELLLQFRKCNKVCDALYLRSMAEVVGRTLL